MGVRLRGRHLRLRATHLHRRAGVRRQRGRRVQALRADTGCIQWMFRAAGRCVSAVVAARLTTGTWCSSGTSRACSTRSRRRRARAVAHPSRCPRVGAADRRTRRSRRRGVRAGGVVGGIAVAQRGLSVLHVPRQPGRPARPRRRPVWKTYLVDEARLTGKTSTGTPTWGPSGCGSWGAPTLDLRAVSSTSRPVTTTRCRPPGSAMPSSRSRRDRPHRVVHTNLGRRRVQLGVQQHDEGPELSSGAGPDHDYGSAAILTRTGTAANWSSPGRASPAMRPDASRCWWPTCSDPAGYGRIVRDAEGRVGTIVEHKDADEEQREIRTVNTGILVGRRRAAAGAGWTGLDNQNAQGEYYLTDVFAAASAPSTTPPRWCIVARADRGGGCERPLAAGATRARLPAARRTCALRGRRAPGRPGTHRRAWLR